jgi:hypothetical protein
LCPIQSGTWYSDPDWNICPSENIYLDTVGNGITYDNMPTWQVQPGVNVGPDAVVNSIAPGDKIVMECWIMTTGTPSAYEEGARIGVDFYGANGRISGASSPQEADAGTDWPNAPSYLLATEANYIVPFGTSTWTLIYWNFTVPSVCIGDGNTPDYAQGATGVPTWCIPWVQILSPESQGYTSYFGDFQFYINP